MSCQMIGKTTASPLPHIQTLRAVYSNEKKVSSHNYVSTACWLGKWHASQPAVSRCLAAWGRMGTDRSTPRDWMVWFFFVNTLLCNIAYSPTKRYFKVAIQVTHTIVALAIYLRVISLSFSLYIFSFLIVCLWAQLEPLTPPSHWEHIRVVGSNRVARKVPGSARSQKRICPEFRSSYGRFWL